VSADDEPRRRAEHAADELGRHGVRGAALTFVDTAGITRVKTVPLRRLPAAAVTGVGMSPVFDTFVSDDSITSTDRLGGPDGDLRLVPDLDRLVALAGQPGWAWAPVDRFEQDGSPYAACQRLFAARMVAAAAEQGLELRMAFEIEWALGERGRAEFVPACTGPAYGMTRLVELSDYAAELLDALERQGTEVEQLHPEYAAGQYEVSVGPTGPVAAADRSVLVRQTIRALSYRHGYQPSFAPSVVAGGVGNGGHVHLSLWRAGENLFAGGTGPHGLTAAAESFMAGVLDQLVPLLAIGAPTPASYLRLVPSHWAGAYAVWGREAREAALRLVTGGIGGSAGSANLEVKCFDLAANPYLVVGALIAAGLNGLARELRLPPEVTGDPARFTAAEAAERGVVRLPQSLAEVTDAFEVSTVLRDAFGDTLADAIVAVRRAERARFADAAPDEIAAALRWVY
jgi:glutamine synthetase